MPSNQNRKTLEISDANLLLISSTGRLLVEAERVRKYRERLLAAIRANQEETEVDQDD